ncbi:MAG: protease inhibitor I42 family protein [Candidatus Bipolaricaulota bacterium]
MRRTARCVGLAVLALSIGLLTGCCRLFLEVVLCSDLVFPGDHALLEVRTCPGAECSIVVILPSGGTSENEELVTKVADAAGLVRWRWLIGPATKPGHGRIEVIATQRTGVQGLAQPLEFRQDRRLTRADDGRTMSVDKEEVFAVTLAGNPTTGFVWEPGDGLVQGVVELIEQDYVPDSCVGPCPPGSGGTFVFRFRASALGATEIRLVYRRPWEETPIDTFTIGVIVL